MTTPKRGRPPLTAGRPPDRAVRLSAETAAKLEVIAVTQGFDHGGRPSVSRAVEWLLRLHGGASSGR